MQDRDNLAKDYMREKMAQMRIRLGLVLKYVTGGEDKVNAVNCLTK